MQVEQKGLQYTKVKDDASSKHGTCLTLLKVLDEHSQKHISCVVKDLHARCGPAQSVKIPLSKYIESLSKTKAETFWKYKIVESFISFIQSNYQK